MCVCSNARWQRREHGLEKESDEREENSQNEEGLDSLVEVQGPEVDTYPGRAVHECRRDLRHYREDTGLSEP